MAESLKFNFHTRFVKDGKALNFDDLDPSAINCFKCFGLGGIDGPQGIQGGQSQ
jgi:hypothetical protein